MHMLTVTPLSVLTLYGLGDMLDIAHDMLDIPQQNPLKYGFIGIEIYIVRVTVHVPILLKCLPQV